MSSDIFPETSSSRKPAPSDEHHENISPLLLNSIKVLIIAVFVYPLLYYTLLGSSSSPGGDDATADGSLSESEASSFIEQNASSHEEAVPVVEVKRARVAVRQPTCELAQHLASALSEACEEVVLRRTLCTPEDVSNLEKHKIPKWLSSGSAVQQGEPRGTIVGCIAAGLLLTSLGAAFVELYKAKSQAPDAGKNVKNPMSRKCSLADLTVLKHNRKELVRRESILEMAQAPGAASKQLGWRPPLYRRCSFPAEVCNYGSIGSSYGTAQPLQESRRNSIVAESRRLSVINESRRNSVDFHSRKPSIIDGKAHSFDESPERRHWTRLVHRH